VTTTERKHAAIVEAWRAERYAALRREIGWLTLAGLGWLREGVNTAGSAADADVTLPAGPERAGTFTVTSEGVAADGAFEHDGAPVRGLRLQSDEEADEPTMLSLGSLRLCLIERGGRFAIRTWDVDAPARRTFEGIDHWPVDPRWRIRARWEPTPDRTVPVPDVLGTVGSKESPGDVVFEMDGATHRLQALRGGPTGELWLIFGDATNTSETYGGGRFLYTQAPDEDGTVVVDFNRAYNPPCVFNPFATCPLPWPENRLELRVEAGEKSFHLPD
jgi:uncharacterized protein